MPVPQSGPGTAEEAATSTHAEMRVQVVEADVRVPITEVDDASSWSSADIEGSRDDLHQVLVEEGTSVGENGLRHPCDADQEVEVIEDHSSDGEDRQKEPRVLGVLTQAEVHAHVATHIPHADRCEVCMKGRGRNTPHRWKNKTARKEEGVGEGHVGIPPVGCAGTARTASATRAES